MTKTRTKKKNAKNIVLRKKSKIEHPDTGATKSRESNPGSNAHSI
jgi:hypothetical protein